MNLGDRLEPSGARERAADEKGGTGPDPGHESAGKPRPAQRGKRRAEWSMAAVAMAVVVWFFHWTVASNSGFEDWGDLDYFKLLVRGWQKGQLHLDKEPAPELLALPDPYDPAQNGPYKLGDASLYKGKYYVYFGAAPALTLMLPYSILTGREMTMGQAVFVFITVGFLVASGLWLALRRRYFPQSSSLTAPLGVLAIGWGTHLLALAQRPMIWELPISAGIAFSLLGLAACYAAMHGARPWLAMAAAGLSLGLAVGSRPTCLFATAMLLGPLWLAWRQPVPGREWWRLAIAAALPLALCGAAIMAHNHARFDHPLEWGQNYQLSGAYESKLVHFSPRFAWHNFTVYFFQWLRWSAEFPFARAVGIEINHIRDYFGTEEVAGLAVTFPFFWGLLGLPLAWRRRMGTTVLPLSATMIALAGYGLPVMALVLCYFSTTTRYQADFAVAIGLLALVGWLGLERWAQEKVGPRQRGVVAVFGAALAVTVVVGTLMSFDYHGRSLAITSPQRWRTLQEAAHHGLATWGLRVGLVEGPRVLKTRFRPQPVGTVETFWHSDDERLDERVLVEHSGEQLIRFGYQRGGGEPVWGRLLRWEPDHTHTVSVQLPSLYPEIANAETVGMRRAWAFRERSSAAVWFSGGRALGVIVAPCPPGTAPGGRVGAEFTGEIRREFRRLFRPDEVDTGLTEPLAPRGGMLRMRVRFSPWMEERGEPLFAAGAHYRSSIIFVQPAGGGLRFAFENYSLPRVESEVFLPRADGHVLEIEMASFRPEAYGVEATGDVVVRLDGREWLRTRQVAYPFPWGAEEIGRNPFGTTTGPDFTGWIWDAAWVR